MNQRAPAAHWVLAAALLMGSSPTRHARAQDQPAGQGLVPHPPAGGVLTPPDHVDPGITRPVPKMPAQSMPVIHPRQLRKTRHGTVRVVPK